MLSLVSLSHRVPGTEAPCPKLQLRGLCAEVLRVTNSRWRQQACAETLHLALGCGATDRAAAPAQGEPCDLLPSDERPQSRNLRMGCPAEGILWMVSSHVSIL